MKHKKENYEKEMRKLQANKNKKKGQDDFFASGNGVSALQMMKQFRKKNGMVDPSKVKLPKELRKIKSKVAKETKSMSFAKQMKRLKSPKKTNPMTNSVGELNVHASMNVSPKNKAGKRDPEGRLGSANRTNGSGMYTTTQDAPTKKANELPAIGQRNTIQYSNPTSSMHRNVGQSTDVATKNNYDNMIKMQSTKKPVQRNTSSGNVNRSGGTSGKFNKAANIYSSVEPKDQHNMRQMHMRQPKLQSQSPYLIVPKGMGQTV